MPSRKPTESDATLSNVSDLERQLAALRAQASAAQSEEDRAKVQKAIDAFNEARDAIDRQIARDAAAAEEARKAAAAKVNARLDAIAAQVAENNATINKACDRFADVEKIAHEIGSTVRDRLDENGRLKQEADDLASQVARLGASAKPIGEILTGAYIFAARVRMAAALKREAIALGAPSILPDVVASLPHARN